jgi:hypothetical protein
MQPRVDYTDHLGARWICYTSSHAIPLISVLILPFIARLSVSHGFIASDFATLVFVYSLPVLRYVEPLSSVLEYVTKCAVA